ncbi:MAG TPA: hypothetical protein VF771_11490 [Longimicrobiaceae bacterium]
MDAMNQPQAASETRQPPALAGFAVLAANFTGAVALAAAFMFLMWGQALGSAVCLLAAAVAFGLVANALLRR